MSGNRHCGSMFLLFHDLIERKKKTVLLCLFAVTLLAAVCVRFLPFENKLDVMLPGDEQLQRMVSFLHEADLAGKVVVSFRGDDREVLVNVVDRFASSVGPPMIMGVMAKISNADMMQDMLFFLHNAPQILDKDDLSALSKRLDAESVGRNLRKRYLQLLKPGGAFMSGMIREDPLGINGIVLGRVGRLQSSLGYDVNIEDGYLVSRDGKHIITVLDTSVSLTDGDGSRRLMAYLHARLQGLPGKVKADVICAHSHTVSNEDVIKRDIKITLTVACVAFLILFLIYFRDPRAVLVFLLPAGAVLLSLNITALIVGRLSGLVIGLGSVIAGIAVDYGIHVYVAVRQNDDAVEAVLEVARPVVLGSLTTISVFIAFMLSSIEGYRQLAWFSIISIVISLCYALFVLPHCLKSGVMNQGRRGLCRWKFPGHRINIGVAAIFAVLLVAGAVAAVHVRFDTEIAGLDGTEKSIIEGEERFQKVWATGENMPAMLVVTAADRESAEGKNEQVYRDARTKLGDDNLVSFASIWPPQNIRKENLRRWQQFWSDDRENILRMLLAEKGKEFSFSEDAFAPFFENLHRVKSVSSAPATNVLFENLQERFVQKHGDEWRIISFFPDKKENMSVVREITARHSNVFSVSRRNLAVILSALVVNEVVRISLVATCLILLVTFLLLGDVRMASVALAPAVAGVVLLLAAMSVLDICLNISNLIAGIVVVGLCIDYGIFMVYACANRIGRGAAMSVSLSAATTLVGAGVLLFAQHPALFSIGLTLVIGILAGYLTAMLVVPSLYAVFGKKGDR
ncbi:MAG: hypothetical protein KAH23_01305 [Kiritimatiellae bacterium]|nr:hypothetical protein [Kiritimatiellia bacterium]